MNTNLELTADDKEYRGGEQGVNSEGEKKSAIPLNSANERIYYVGG